ncbi:S9 family peptidase [Rothia sp. LK2588]|uniref:S9 family peptidase n=1 Tax=Rothia sp. LK2588 TaxID=3114369 RepID=UPI0034CE5910
MTPVVPPRPHSIPTERSHHGDSFSDPFEWLRDKENPEVIEYLKAENEFTTAQTAAQDELRQTIFEEIKGRVQETDLSVPTRIGQWWYYSRTVEGEQYPVMCRVAAAEEGSVQERFTPPFIEAGVPLEGEQVLLDCNEFARDLSFFSLGSFDPSLDGQRLTFSVDDTGDERYTQYVMDLQTGQLLPDRIEDIFAGAFFTPDATHIVYTVVDDSWRPYEIRVHEVGQPTAENDRVIYTEQDAALWLEAALSEDRTHLVITSYSSEFSEIRLLPVGQWSAPAQVVIEKAQRVQYAVEPLSIGDQRWVVIVHDHQALNSEIVLAPYPTGEPFETYRQSWIKVMPHRSETRVESVSFTATHLVASVRQDTTLKVCLTPLEGLRGLLAAPSGAGVEFAEPHGFTEEIYTTAVTHTSIDSPVVRMSYTSWVTPQQVYDYYPDTEELVLRRATPVLGGYRPDDYTAYRMWAPAEDGTMIPLSIIHRADLDKSQPHPVLQYGYGSYEASMDPYFSYARLSLLDRGVIYVVAHIRGGGELGRGWYQEGKKLQKKNTFTDFVAVTDFLREQAWVDASRIVIEGGSAGGLLIGATLNLAPEKYAGAIAEVPFVDALTTILDPELPLSALEWEEWGNPITDPDVYHYMKSYSPYENIRPVKYPPIVAITSLHDTRVFYVEPAKWIAKLRETIDPGSPTPLLKIEMDGGHGGGSGRYTRWRDTAWVYAWALTQLSAA